jgi:hypothetical protein
MSIDTATTLESAEDFDQHLSTLAAARSAPTAVGPLLAARLVIDRNQMVPGRNAFRAFVATNSTSPIILATLAESNVAAVGNVMFCGNRLHGGRNGILVTILSPNPMPDGAVFHITLAQEGATQFAPPVFYNGW